MASKGRQDISGATTGCRYRRPTTLDELNRQLLAACQQDEQRRIGGRAQTVGAGDGDRAGASVAVGQEGMDLAEMSFRPVDGMGCVKVRTNTYSVPVPAGTESRPKCYPAGGVVARRAVCGSPRALL